MGGVPGEITPAGETGAGPLAGDQSGVKPAAADDWARPLVRWEIVARDPERQAEFYRELFRWEIGDGPIRQVAPGLGGPEPGPGGHIRRGDQPGVVLYVQVRDLRASLARAQELGAALASRREPPADRRSSSPDH